MQFASVVSARTKKKINLDLNRQPNYVTIVSLQTQFSPVLKSVQFKSLIQSCKGNVNTEIPHMAGKIVVKRVSISL